ncbi:hypothetical protein [Streptomyces sp. NBC_01281]|uniref:hypothetical protein n=1 Tax=Streptomyces sp. NBC_01281 TaxID=2903811 RepID=UPI002E111DF8
MIDANAFDPPTAKPGEEAPKSGNPCRPARPVVQMLYVRYLASRPVEEIQCVAQTRRRQRCTAVLLIPDSPVGNWRMVPATVDAAQLALPAAVMAMYDLTGLPYSEQLRWRAQRCLRHAVTPSAPDMAVTDWEPFNPLLHQEHIHSRLPRHIRRPGLAERDGRHPGREIPLVPGTDAPKHRNR